MLSEVAAGVLVDVVAAVGRRLGTAAVAFRGRRYAEDVAIARWFDTYRLTDRVPALPDLPPDVAGKLAEALGGNEVQAVLHELLAARLTDAPEADVDRIRTVFGLTLDGFGADVPDSAAESFAYFDAEICALVGRLEGAEPSMLREIRGEALSARMIATLQAIERHTAALTARPGRRAESDFLVRYRRHVAEQHGKLEPPDFERRRRVPIAELYVPPGIVQVTEADRKRAPRELDLWQLAGEIDRTVLLGDPGAGKTTAANVLLHHHADDPTRRVPFLVTLREFAAQEPPERSVAGHIEHRLDTFYQCPAPAGLVERLLLTGRALVIFDGLDELLDTSRRSDVTARVERFADQYPLAQVLVTSRQVGYDQARLDDRQFIRYRVGRFADEQVGEYVRKWFAQEEGIDPGEAERWAAAFLEESAATPDLRANPLMLALMCILYRGEGSLPRNRTEVYEQCANLLFRKWDARRRIHLDLRAGHHLEPALRHLAWWLFTRDQPQPAVTEHELVAEITAFLYGRGFESRADAREAASEFVGFCRGRMWVLSDAGTTAAGEALYSFTHRTFLEYFAGAHLAYQCDTPERLARSLASHVALHEWEVVGELAVQIKDCSSDRGAQRVYATLLSGYRRRSAAGRGGVLQFLARCLRSVDPSPQTVRDLTRDVLDHLLAGQLDDRLRCLPLSWLLGSCAACKLTVSEEIAARIPAMAGAGDPADRMNGLVLAVWLPVFGNWGWGGPRLSPGSPLSLYWREQTAGNVRACADAILAEAVHHTAMRHAALQHDLLTVAQALEMPGGLLPLVQEQYAKIFDHHWTSYFMNAIYELAHGDTDPYYPGTRDGLSKAIDDLAGLGRYLLAHPQLPWITGPAEGWEDYFGDIPAKRAIPPARLDPIAYLGGAATLLISIEYTKSRALPSARQLGPLRDLHPYIDSRCGGSYAELPDLPVPDTFRQTFRDWAGNKVSFAQPHSADPAAKADPAL
jgi:NACHT domain